MVNIATIALTHAIMLLAAWRLLSRHDLDRDPASGQAEGQRARNAKSKRA